MSASSLSPAKSTTSSFDGDYYNHVRQANILSMRRYYAKNRDKELQRFKAYYQKNKEKIRAYKKRVREQNKLRKMSPSSTIQTSTTSMAIGFLCSGSNNSKADTITETIAAMRSFKLDLAFVLN
ncbi:unnamed protein product [Aphanomyces euteiches]|uniref:Uncharacterized protein n=1 Tax=Aphanomyces euteiches TaxID=100861 RepID=A0A6G0WIH1_9STRA|nr:hypothetical protein Ae201684_014877 [Aphanomyces euteiches]KAH9072614.1 hypothetical protein Ae201684P_015689 [Aphanomyces euteiches]KAH9139459.1 hypothetical protein AeRB84_016268 [Aphanomyces euteiches]